MDGLYLYCQVCNNYVGGCDCGCGWRNRYLREEQESTVDFGEVTTEQLIQELSARVFHSTPEEFEELLDELRGNYVRD